jgi:hypothetical protein
MRMIVCVQGQIKCRKGAKYEVTIAVQEVSAAV